MWRRKLKIALGVLIVLALAAAGYVFYLYQQGGTENYRPPEKKAASPRMQALRDLTILSQAVDAYYAKNLQYPETLDQLKPEFIATLPGEPGANPLFRYESDGLDRYRITVSDPSRYGLKELFAENGEITEK